MSIKNQKLYKVILEFKDGMIKEFCFNNEQDAKQKFSEYIAQGDYITTFKTI